MVTTCISFHDISETYLEYCFTVKLYPVIDLTPADTAEDLPFVANVRVACGHEIIISSSSSSSSSAPQHIFSSETHISLQV
ncbi:hypothetical protein AC579_3073 [Pseudocercospora musae]|uniref:Uncharacterized protein n=1 Tax=Pseudocercospora musae TaxID=113226 RepID=A0A139IJN0_9PEZI|nr:hypothetical protein AC579_3073 [Pseudocercospora musae]